MSTRSSTRNIFPPLDNPELTIRRRSRADPNLLNDFKMAAEGNGDLPVLDLRTMKELCQPFLNGRGGPISSIAIQATNFGLKNDMIQQVHNSCQFHGLSGDDANKHLDKFLHSESSSSITSSSDTKITALKAEMEEINKNLMRVLQVNQQVKAVTPNYETCGGPHYFNDCPATVGNTQNIYTAGAYQGGNYYQPQERKTEATKDTVHPTNNESTKDVQPLVVQTKSLILNSEPVVTPIIEPVGALVSALRPNQRPSILGEKISLPDLSPTCMTLELADHLISYFDADPRVPLILERSFLKTGRSLINVFEGELTLCVGKEAITFNLNQISRYSTNYNDMMAKRIDVIDMACEEYSQDVLSFLNLIASGDPTLYYDPIVSTTFPTITPFGNSDFLLEEVDAFLTLEDDPTSPKVDQSYVNTEGDILLLEAFLNDDPSLPPPNQGNYLP
nr:reverse transcriptase domain-containing protein [Tanacetum cinerariifolium]